MNEKKGSFSAAGMSVLSTGEKKARERAFLSGDAKEPLFVCLLCGTHLQLMYRGPRFVPQRFFGAVFEIGKRGTRGKTKTTLLDYICSAYTPICAKSRTPEL